MTNATILTFTGDSPKAPNTENGTVPPLKQKSTKPRDYLTKQEIDALLDAAKKTRHGHRLHTMITFAFRHGMRVNELVNLLWSDVHFDDARVHIRRSKGSNDSIHPIQGDELRALRKLKRESTGVHVFISERATPYSEAGFRKALNRLGAKINMTWTLSPHALRHSCGFYLANEQRWDVRRIAEYLGHRNIQNTMRYTMLASHKFDGLTF